MSALLNQMDPYQATLVLPFISLGGWCLVHPSSVESLCVVPEQQHQSPLTSVLIRCFGSQAVLGGLTIATMQPTSNFYAAFGAAIVPFFAFNVWGLTNSKLFTKYLWLDVIGNVIFAAAAYKGYTSLQEPAIKAL